MLNEKEFKLLIWAIGLHIGVARPQGLVSQYISEVRATGMDYRSTSGRGYNSSAKLDFHTDGCDIVGLACYNKAMQGGQSLIASSVTAWQKLLFERPDLANIIQFAAFTGMRQSEIFKLRSMDVDLIGNRICVGGMKGVETKAKNCRSIPIHPSIQFLVKENNWLGKGVTVSANAEVSADSVRGAVSLTDPDYNFTGKELSYYLKNVKNDKSESGYENSLFGAGVGISYERFKDIYFSPGLSLTYDDLTTDSTASTLLKSQSGSATDLMFDYSLSTDKRDRRFMPTNGYLTSFFQELPVYADQPYLKNSFSTNHYKEISEDVVGALKFNITSINGLNDEDVRVSQRLTLSSKKLRGFESGKIGPKDGNDYIGGNYATSVNLEANFPNFFPEKSNADIGLFLDAGNLWGIDYSDTLEDSNKIRSTAGINTSWLSPAGPLSFIFSKNITKASTDVSQSFNFRLGTTF